jgi:hypothetical protein
MRRKLRGSVWVGTMILGVLATCPLLSAQASSKSNTPTPLPNDWTHQHVIFSQPATPEQARRVKQDPRYAQQKARHGLARSIEPAAGALPLESQIGVDSLPGGDQLLDRDWSMDLGGGGTVGPFNYPAKFSLATTTANCGGAPQPDFVVYNTGLMGSSTQASIAAFDNLYSGCGGTVPAVYWAYGTGATVLTSPVFSRDGTQLTFVQQTNTLHGILVLLKWAASITETISSPLSLPAIGPALYPACVAPCRTTIPLFDSGSPADDTHSSVFYDYSNDVAYVGDDSGFLHKFTPVFLATPREVTTGGWPVQVNPGSPMALGSPVHDFGSGNIFVSDVGGFLYRVNSSTAAVTTSGQLDFSAAEGGAGIVQGPIVDSTAGLVFVFASSDGSGSCIGGTTDCTAVYQLSTGFLTGDVGSESIVGASTIPGNAPSPLYIGAFDSTYENSANATGNLYVCGNTGGPPILYQVPIVAGAMNGLGTPGPVLSTVTTPCSPVTDVANPNVAGGTEWIFASAENGGAASTCAAGGCIFNFKDTPWKPLTSYAVGQEVLDTHFQLQVVSIAGTSGAAAPGWSTIIGHSTTDGTVHWLNQGQQSAFTLAAWMSGHAYALHAKILDGNKNVQFVTTAGTSGGTLPAFSTTAGGVTSDGATLKWTNLGALGTASLAAAGGTSGIIIDNTVGSGTLAGASQVYFSTLSDQACSDGTGGCAVQASQSALQ